MNVLRAGEDKIKIHDIWRVGEEDDSFRVAKETVKYRFNYFITDTKIYVILKYKHKDDIYNTFTMNSRNDSLYRNSGKAMRSICEYLCEKHKDIPGINEKECRLSLPYEMCEDR